MVFIGRGWTCLIQFSGVKTTRIYGKHVENNGGLGLESFTQFYGVKATRMHGKHVILGMNHLFNFLVG